MTCRTILTYPHRSLVTKSEPVYEFGDETTSVVQDLIDTLEVNGGVGLAAPQVNILKRVVVVKSDVSAFYEFENPDPCELNPAYLVLINPKLQLSGDEVSWEEACLSVPGYSGRVKRSTDARVEYQNIKGEKCVLDAGWPASGAIQHECDHLDGILYIRRLGWYSRQAIEKKIRKRKKRLKEAAAAFRASRDDAGASGPKHGSGKRKRKPKVKRSKIYGRQKKRKK